MARLVVFIDHDIMIRHFVLNGVLSPLGDKHELVFVFPQGHKRVRADLDALPIQQRRTLPISQDRLQQYRRLYHTAVLAKARRSSRAEWLNTKRWFREILDRRSFWESWLYSWPPIYPVYRSWVLAGIGENRALDDLLRHERPDVIVHPTVLEGLFISDLIRWGQQHSVPTVFLMNSWDNPSTKALMVGHPDRLVVWGEQTKRHAVQYLGIPQERVVCLGAAQFELYRSPPKESPEAFRRRLGISSHQKILLYAGSSKGLNETAHLLRLERAIEEKELEGCVVLYRPHPWRAYPEGEADFYSLTWKHVILDPSMEACYRSARGTTRVHVELADYADAHVTLRAVDAVISPLSTILLEAALLGKPIAAYLPEEDVQANWYVSVASKIPQFTEFFERVDCIRCERPERLVEDCRRLLQATENPGIAEKLKRQCEYFVVTSEEPYGIRLSRLIGELLESSEGTNGWSTRS